MQRISLELKKELDSELLELFGGEKLAYELLLNEALKQKKHCLVGCNAKCVFIGVPVATCTLVIRLRVLLLLNPVVRTQLLVAYD